MWIPEEMMSLLTEAKAIWEKGGWAMYALMGNCLFMYVLGASMMTRLLSKGFCNAPDRAWKRYRDPEKKVRGPAGRMIAAADRKTTLRQIENYFEAVKKAEIDPFERDLMMMKVFVGAAPLLGLLGTVTGMLATFGALATGSGGDKTMNLVAGGISEALTGLMFQSALIRQHERYGKFIEHLENLCMQHFRRERKGDQVMPPRRAAEEA